MGVMNEARSLKLSVPSGQPGLRLSTSAESRLILSGSRFQAQEVLRLDDLTVPIGIPKVSAAPEKVVISRSGLTPAQLAETKEISDIEYHADKRTATSTKLKTILRSGAHLKDMLESPRKETDAMRLGTALHSAVLEPDRFKVLYAVYRGKGDRGTKEYKDFVASHPHMRILTASDYGKVIKMRDAVLSFKDPTRPAFDLGCVISMSEREKTLEWVDAETGVPCKIRLDILNRAFIGDIKKCQDARRVPFGYHCFDMDYDVQAAMYRDGVEKVLGLKLPFNFIAVEEKCANAVCIYTAPQAMLEEGHRRYRQAIHRYAECLATDKWPGYESPIDEGFWPTHRRRNQ
ncbi:hypothetical protein HA052_04795 [Chromobacterium haemolyticum]|uniref:Putative exodeoxyribonuclease 8 PDDEXK-like domain-containing protein n=1 Tax=Chromobacterium fluminis TaxID=3044269 RepID=A0ABX0L0P9_9NEIS|nr:PD-(D/E)XK nuclease-like domain-containing protein [Chromobacterium haemolyticum]NHR04508.1 hypothetical protein [Chromobacterium haemolyticum]